jgi:phage shock protein A
MRLIKRVNAILTAQLNEIVDTFEKPERMLKQAIREMETALERAVESTAKAIAAEKRLRRELTDCRGQAQSWQDRAVKCVDRNEDANARQALARKAEKEKLAESLGRQLVQSEESTARLRRQLETLRERLAEARRHLASLVARQRTAEARRQFVQALGHFDADIEAFRRFEELADRVDQTEAEVEAQSELCGADFEAPGRDSDVEADLQALKQQRAAETAGTNRGE